MRLAQYHIDPAVELTWSCCPLRGHQAAEISAGQFTKAATDLFTTTAADFVASPPQGLPAASQRKLIRDFNAARTHVVFYYTLKLSHMSEMLWRLFQISHTDFP